MCRCLDVSHSGLLHLGVAGVCRKPAKRRRETRHFCDVFLQRLQTNPPVIDGPTKSWNAMVLQPVPRDGAPAHAAWRAWRGCQPRPKAHNYHACRRPSRSPDLIERNFTAGAPAQKLVGDITYIHTREGFVYPAGCDGAACSKRIVGYAMAEHMRTELVQKALQNLRLGTASPSRV